MGVYTGNPNATPVTAAELPPDNATLKASDVDTPFEALLDDAAYVLARGVRKLYTDTYDVAGGTFDPSGFAATSFAFPGSNGFILTDLTPAIGDILLVQFSTTIEIPSAASPTDKVELRLVAVELFNTVPTLHAIPGARLRTSQTTVPDWGAVAISGAWTVTAAGQVKVGFQGKVQTSGTTFVLHEAYSLVITHLRKF
jgi:hypothetical protein